MDFKPVIFNELNRVKNEDLLQMSKNDTLIRLISERQCKGVIYKKELGEVRHPSILNTTAWNTIDTINITPGVGRLLQFRLFIPFTNVEPDGGEDLYGLANTPTSYLRARNTTSNKTIAWHTRQYRAQADDAFLLSTLPEYANHPAFGEGGYPGNAYFPAGNDEGTPNIFGEMRQSVFMMSVFPTYDVASHQIIVQVKTIRDALFYRYGGFIVIEDVGSMPAIAPTSE